MTSTFYPIVTNFHRGTIFEFRAGYCIISGILVYWGTIQPESMMIEHVLSLDIEATFDGGGAPCYVVKCETKRGVIYEYPEKFYGEDGHRAAERFISRVQRAGIIQPERWDYFRAIYGSQAWIDDGHEDAQVEREYMDDLHGTW